MNKIFTFKIGGEAGQGQQVAGTIFAKACARGGLYTFNYSEYPSRIRGGQVAHQVSIAATHLTASWQEVNLLIALTRETIDLHVKELSKDAVILYDSDKIKVDDIKKFKCYPMPLANMAKQANVKPLAQNMIALGVLTGLLGYRLEALIDVINSMFADKGQEVADMNIKAANFGHEYAIKNFAVDKFHYKLSYKKEVKGQILATANDTVALGAVAAGCNFFAGYPMTPATTIMHNLANWAQETGIVVKHAEDEIAAIHMALGASWAGARAMTATSGGGFALMNEGLSLAGMTETPVVIAESQRPGPATGLPTWTEQSDLLYIVNSGHGEFIRVVLAPGDAQEAFYLTSLAFNLAEKYQIPVFILLDKYISEATELIDALDINKIKIERGQILTEADLAKTGNYLRYKVTKSGISPRSLPGQAGGLSLINSDEHNEYGFSIEGFQSDIRIQQQNKRWAKLPALMKELPAPKLFGPKKAKLTLLGWGSTKGPVLEALKQLPKVNYVHVSAPYPLSDKKLLPVLKGAKKIVVIENNMLGQLAGLLKQQTSVKIYKQINKYEGRQFWPEEIVEKVKKLI